jgi:CheY-like chemotaxis protein
MVERSIQHILVVEDQYLIGLMIADQLKELGYQTVGPVYAIEDARRLAKYVPIHAAILDWDLDGARSSELADILTARGIPYLFATGYNKLPLPRFSKVLVLSKPWGLSDLRDALKSILPNGAL